MRRKKYKGPPTALRPDICVICGTEIGKVITDEKFENVCASIEPCNVCKDTYLKDGTLLIEAIDNIPTGRTAVISDEAFKMAFETEELIPSKIALVVVGTLEKIGAIKPKEV